MGITQEFMDVLLNEEVIAVDQDALSSSAQGIIIVNNTNVMSAQVSVWHKPLADGTRAVALLNTGLFDASDYNLTLTSEMIGFQPGQCFHARSLWERRDIGTFHGNAQFWLDPTSIMMLKVKAVNLQTVFM